jgi:uncharacterized protein (UPF0332 family)
MNAKERVIQARDSMEDARIFLHEHMGNKAVLTKLYHAMMNCLFALFNIQDIGKLTHADIIERFEQEYVRTGKIAATVLDVLRRAYDLTHECDCDHMPVPTDEETASVMKAAEELVSTTEGLLGAEAVR